MRSTTVILAGLAGGLVALAGAAYAAESGKSVNWRQYVDKYAPGAAPSASQAKIPKIAKIPTSKVRAKNLAGLKSLPKWRKQVLRGSGQGCEHYKELFESTGDWRWISRYYQCRY